MHGTHNPAIALTSGSISFIESDQEIKNTVKSLYVSPTASFEKASQGQVYGRSRNIISRGRIWVYDNLLLPYYETDADIVYGSRFLGGSKYVRIHFFWHYLAHL